MMKTLLRSTLSALCLVSLPFTAMAQGQGEAAERLNELLSSARTITADFSQMTLSSNGASMQETEGTLEVKRPGMFRWHTDPPLEQELVSDGQKIWLYDPDLEQVTIQSLDQRMSHTPALLLSGDVSTIEESFTISWNQGGTVEDFVLEPKDNESMFDNLRLSFRDGVLNDMQMSDPIGQRTNILFQNVEMNPQLPDSRFTFEIPQGVDVISE